MSVIEVALDEDFFSDREIFDEFSEDYVRTRSGRAASLLLAGSPFALLKDAKTGAEGLRREDSYEACSLNTFRRLSQVLEEDLREFQTRSPKSAVSPRSFTPSPREYEKGETRARSGTALEVNKHGVFVAKSDTSKAPALVMDRFGNLIVNPKAGTSAFGGSYTKPKRGATMDRFGSYVQNVKPKTSQKRQAETRVPEKKASRSTFSRITSFFGEK